MSNKLNPFEEQLKKAAEGHSVPYDANQWTQLEKQLDIASPVSGLRIWGIAAVSILLIGTAVYFSLDKEENQTVHQELADQGTAVIEPVSKDLVVEKVPKAVNTFEAESNAPMEEVVLKTTTDVKEIRQDKPVVTTVPIDEEPEFIVEKEANTVPVNETETKEEEQVIPTFVLPSVVLNINTTCAGTPITATISDPSVENIEWYLGDGTIFKGKELNHVFLEGGVFEIKAFIIAQSKFTDPISVVIQPKPDASFTIKNEFEDGMIPVQKFSVDVEGEKSYVWNVGEGMPLKGTQISHTFTKAGEYPISLRVMNKQGCSWTMYDRVIIEKDFNLLAPAGFTPNGDGLNDTYLPEALKAGYYNFELKIFDRNSNLIFESNAPEDRFDGKANGRLPVSGDIFIWKAITTDPSGVQQEFGGTFMAL